MLSALRNFFLTFLISALIFGGLAYFVVGFVLDALSVAISADTTVVDTPRVDITTPAVTTPADTTAVPPEPVEEINGDTFNILLIGTDYQPDRFDDYNYEETWTGSGFPDKRNREWSTDTLIILRVDKENHKFVFCSLPRNLRVLVDGIPTQLGEVYYKKGIDYLCGKVTGLTGLVMNYYASVSVSAIEECVDAVGGIKYYVPEDMKYEDELQGLVIDLEKGTHQIDGAKAAQLLRYVGYANGNTGRMSTVVSFLQAMLAKFTNITYATKIPAFYTAVAENIETNFTADDLINNLDLLLAYSKFESVTVSYPGSARVYDGISYFEPATASALDLFETYK
jgi:LCP family protein required for cell wall assembly